MFTYFKETVTIYIDMIAILLAFLDSKLGSTAKYLANPPCKDEPTDADQEDKEAELLVTRSQCVNNRLHNKPISASKIYSNF